MGHGLKRGSTIKDPSIAQATVEKILKLEPVSLEESIIWKISATWFLLLCWFVMFVFWGQGIGVKDSFKDTANKKEKRP